MKLEQQVTSLELSRKLKELGVKQEGYFTWYKHLSEDDGTEVWTVNSEHNRPYANPMFSAFTVAELGEMLPKTVLVSRPRYRARMFYLHCGRYGVGAGHRPHFVKYWFSKVTDFEEREETEVHARATMLIYLIENKLIPVANLLGIE